MRKVDANSLRSKFDDDIRVYAELFTKAVGSDSLSLAEQSLMAEHTLLAAAIRWEGFLSDLFIAYINRDPSGAQASVENALKESAKSKFGAPLAGKLNIDGPKHLLRDEVAVMLDSEGRNVTFQDADTIVSKATRWLDTTARARFTAISGEDKAAINAWIKLRHFLAHRSAKARAELNDALAVPDLRNLPNEDMARGADKVSNVGSFLKAAPTGTARVLRYLSRMRAIACAL